MAELRGERQRLLPGENVRIREGARAARFSAQANPLAEPVKTTETAAERPKFSLNRTAFGELQRDVLNLTGPEVAELARGLFDGDGGPRRGPPEDRGPSDAETEADDAPGRNASDDPGDERGPPTDVAGAGNATDDGADSTDGDAGERGPSGQSSDGDADGAALESTAEPTPTPAPDGKYGDRSEA